MDGDRGAEFLDKVAARLPRAIAPSDLVEQVEQTWREGLNRGASTGWSTVDVLYTVAPGMLTIVTGWPSSGKSEWIDALTLNLTKVGWKIAMFSPENLPLRLHAIKLIEKMSGQPFAEGLNERLPQAAIAEYLDELSQSFAFLATRDGLVTVDGVVESAWSWLEQFPDSPKGLVIDPWNELEHHRPTHLSETEYISRTLSTLRQWARQNQVHVWLVAHPKNYRREDGKELPVPRPDMISGSQHWWNKADFALTVHRAADPVGNSVQIHSFKSRFKHLGRVGMAVLDYDIVTGRYSQSWGALSRPAP